MDQSGGSRPEAACAEVERREMLLEVDVEPLTPCRLGMQCSTADERCGYSSPLMLASDLGIDEEGVIAAIPRHVDKADQGAAIQAGCYPAQAVQPHLVPSSGHCVPTVGLDEFHHFHVGDCSAPAVLHQVCHRHIPAHRAC